MKFNRIILTTLFSIFFLISFFNQVKADDRICGNDLTNFIYDYHVDEFEYLEKRNDSGIFFDFIYDKNNKKIITKRNKDNFPIVKFSFFEKEKIIPGKTAIKSLNSYDLSKLDDEQLDKLTRKSGKINIFAGPLIDNTGKEIIPVGKVLDDGALWGMNYYLQGVNGKVPG